MFHKLRKKIMILQMVTGLLLAVAIQGKHTSFIGFTAWKQAPQMFVTGERVFFEGVLINEGNAYDKLQSQFNCPVSGVYYISTNLMSDGSSFNVKVMVGLTEVMHVYSSSLMGLNTASNSIIANCTAGELVYIEAIGCVDDCGIYGETGIPYTTFTVMMLETQANISQKHTSLPGFSVAKERLQTFQTQDVITFDRIIYADNNYLPDLYSYNCTSEGVYYINFNTQVVEFEALQLAVEKSTVPVLHAADVSSNNYYNSISNSGLITCRFGQFIVVKASGDGEVYGDPGEFRTTFSGFRISDATFGSALYHSDTVGFSVFKKTPQNYTENEVIMFDGILWDDNKAFDRVLSRFECVLEGIYYVSVTFRRVANDPLWLQVERESLPVLTSEDTSYENAENTISNSGLVRCFEGEHLQVVSTGMGSVYGDISQPFTTFTVFYMSDF